MAEIRMASIAAQLNDNLRAIAPFVKKGAVLHLKNHASLAKPPAPAWYIPSTADLYLHIDEARIDFRDFKPASLYRPNADTLRAMGLIIHEAAHSARSDWLDEAHKDKSMRPYLQTLTLFEEIRIETFAVNYSRATAHTRPALRASFDLVLSDGHMPATTSRTAAAYNWALLVGRVFAGVAEMGEVEAVDNAARTLLGDETVDELEDILQEVLVTEGLAALGDLARRWTEVVNDPEPEELVIIICGLHSDEGGEPVKISEAGEKEATDGASGDGDADDDDSEDTDADADASDTDFEGANHGASPASDQPVFHPEDGALLDDAIKNAVKDIASNKTTKEPLGDPSSFAKSVFGKKPSGSSRVWKNEVPTPRNRQDVVKMARVLETLSIPAVTKIKAGSALPPGRFRSREAIAASADRAAGRMTDAKPWTMTKRRYSRVRPIVVGIATDTSGSMGWAENAVAEYAYIMSNAGHRIGARTAAVTFGDRAEAVTWPGQVASRVRVRSANGGTEAFDDGIAALDGVLKLTRKNDAAKLLLIVSDGMLVRPGETQKATQWMEKCHAAGVAVVWLTVGDTKVIKTIAPKAEVVALSARSYYHADMDGPIIDKMLAATKAALEKLEAA